MNRLWHINKIRNYVNRMARDMAAGRPFDQTLIINTLTAYTVSGLQSSAIRQSIERLADNWEIGSGKAQVNRKIHRNIINYLAVQKMVARIEEWSN
jgi:hypothetical protein